MEGISIDRMLSDFFDWDDLGRLTVDAGKVLACPLMVLDDTFRIVSQYSPQGFSDTVFAGAVARGQVTYEAGAIISGSAELRAGHPAFVAFEDSPYRRRFAPLINGGVRLGYLICVDAWGNLENVPQKVFHMVETVLAKQLFVEASRQDKPLRTTEEILTRLLDGGFSSPAMFRLQIADTYLESFHPAAFALLNLETYHSLALGRNALKEAILAQDPESHPFIYQGDVFVFLHRGFDPVALESFAKKFSLTGVISLPVDDLFSLPERYRTTQEGLDIVTCSSIRGKQIYSVEELAEVIMITRLRRHGGCLNPQVQALAKSDREKGTQFCRTLYAYLVNNHSLQAAGEATFTHRNTILYRLRRMKEEFSIPLDNPAAHTELLLSAALELLDSDGPEYFLGKL